MANDSLVKWFVGISFYMIILSMLGILISLNMSTDYYIDMGNSNWNDEVVTSYLDDMNFTDGGDWNETEFENWVDDNKLSIFGKALLFNISGLGIFSLLFVGLPVLALVVMLIVWIRG